MALSAAPSSDAPVSYEDPSGRRLRQIARKSLLYLRPMWPHLAALLLAGSALTLMLVPVGLLLVDVLWTRILLGTPLPADQAALLQVPVEAFTTGSQLSGPQRQELLSRWLYIAAFTFALGIPCGLALFAYQTWVLQRVNQGLRVDILERLQSLSLRFHREHAAGDAIYRIVQDASTVSRFLEALVLTPAISIGRFLIGVSVVALFDPLFALLLSVVWLPLSILAWRETDKLRCDLREARAASAAVTTRVQELAAALPVVKACGSEEWDAARFARESQLSFNAAREARMRVATYEVQVYWVLGIAMVIAVVAGAAQTRAEESTTAVVLGIQVWTLGLWTFFRSRFSDTANQARIVFVNWGRAQDVFAGLGRVFDLLEREPEMEDTPDAINLSRPREGIRFDEVTFRFAHGQTALERVSFDAPTGSITAIVGPSGAGKSTLLSLLLRLGDPDEGEIFIDGVPLHDFRRASLRDGVSIALQEPLLFGGTIAENIRWAVPEASDEEMREAARVACADAFIESLPDGYETELGERGVKLSTGQRQRLSIARAVLKDPYVLLLDEPTAALDAATEERLVSSLRSWGRDRTLLVVTHRPGTAAMADRVLALDHGRVRSLTRTETSGK